MSEDFVGKSEVLWSSTCADPLRSFLLVLILCGSEQRCFKFLSVEGEVLNAEPNERALCRKKLRFGVVHAHVDVALDYAAKLVTIGGCSITVKLEGFENGFNELGLYFIKAHVFEDLHRSDAKGVEFGIF